MRVRSVLLQSKHYTLNRPPNFHFRANQTRFGNLQWAFNKPQATDTFQNTNGPQTKVTSLIDGDQVFTTISQCLSQAKKSVYLEMYELESPRNQPHNTSGNTSPGSLQQQQLISQLIQLRQRGIDVKVILDNSFDPQLRDFRNQALIHTLKSKGIEVLSYPRNMAQIDHVKLLIIDNQTAIIGGMNWGNHSPTNHDACILVEGPNVQEILNHIFQPDYQRSGGKSPLGAATASNASPNIKVLTTVPRSQDGLKTSEIRDEIINQIDSAQKSIICELFTISNKAIADKLIKANQRVIQNQQPGVRILVDPGLFLRFKGCQAMVEYLARHGVPIRFYRVNWQNEEKLHAKWGVFDDKTLIIGSANWSTAGLEAQRSIGLVDDKGQPQLVLGNHEADLAINSPKLCEAFTTQFEYDWSYKSMPIRQPDQLIQDIPPQLRSHILGK